MQVKNGKDFWAGLMFTAFGLGFMLVAINNYNMGTAVRMGPAYFPTLLGGLQAILGLAIFIRAFASKHPASMRVIAFRWLPLLVGVALCVAAYFLKGSNSGVSYFVHQVVLCAALISLVAAFGPPSLYVILAAVLVFAFVLKPLGLFLSTMILVILSRAKSEVFSWGDIPKSIVYGVAVLAVFYVLQRLLGAAIGAGYGMSIATVVTIVGAIWLANRMKGMELGMLFGVLGVFSTAVFVFGLGLPFNVCPEALDDVCRNIGLGK